MRIEGIKYRFSSEITALMAAAPDMLAALQPLANAAEAWKGQNENNQVSIPLGMLRAAAAAISKATNATGVSTGPTSQHTQSEHGRPGLSSPIEATGDQGTS